MGKSFYFFNDGKIKRKDNTLTFVMEELGKKDLPIEQIEDIYLFSEININTTALNFIAQNKIPIHFFNYYDFYTGTFYPREMNVSGKLLVKQVQFYEDYDKRLEIAKEFVNTCTHNIYRNLRYYNGRGKDVEVNMESIQKHKESIYGATTIQELMGIEGNIHKSYYQSWNSIVNQDINFEKRVRQPPDNVINTMISFVNTLVYTRVLSEIYKTQLNPTIAYLHEPSTSRFSLCLDIAEVFKPVLADRLIFSLLNKNQITENSFTEHLNYLHLKKAAVKTIVEEFDKKLKTTVKHPTLKREVTYEYLIRLECYKLIKHLLEDKKYEGFKMWW